MSTVIELRPGNGGADAEGFCHELCNSISKYLTRNGWKHSVETATEKGRGFSIDINVPISKVKWLAGTHVVQRIPRGSSARHTSSAVVLVRKKEEEVHVEVNPADVRIDRYRGTGKGGQHRNKVSTAVRVVHKPTGIIITRESGRSQSANLDSAMSQLRSELTSRANRDAHSKISADRVVGEDKTFTHNHQRSEVTHHVSGKTWRTKDWATGKFSA